MRRLVAVLLSLTLSLAFAGPALAGDKIEGDGYEIRLPPGFTEAMSVEGAGKLRIKSRFGNLPVDGMPEIRAYTAGSGAMPDGMIMLARVNLTRTITTAGELGLDQIEKMKSQLPEGVDIQSKKIAGHDAIEMTIRQDGYDSERTARVASIAAGDYVVVVMMDTSDEAFSDSATMWTTMIASMKVEPGMNKIVLFGLVGAAGLIGLWFLGRVQSRSAHDVPDYTGRFKRQDADTGPGFPPRDTADMGHRPKVLASRPGMGVADVDMPARGQLSTPAPMSGGRFASDGAAAPVRTPTSPAVTRPAPTSQTSKPGLRRTRPNSGRWGE